jgi:hypothetical protein
MTRLSATEHGINSNQWIIDHINAVSNMPHWERTLITVVIVTTLLLLASGLLIVIIKLLA